MSTEPITRFEKRRRKTRGALLAAAHGLIVERGYDAVSIQDITDEADLGRGTFYLHFKDKEELVWTIIQDEFEKGAAALETGLRGLSLDQRDYVGFVGFFSYIAAQRDLFQAVAGGMGVGVITEYIADYTAGRAALRLAEDDPFADLAAPPEVSAQFMTGALMRLVRWWLIQPDRYTPVEMAALFYRLLYRRPPPDMPG